MPKIVFKSTRLDIKRDLLDRIIDGYLSDGSITRAHVAKNCNVSKTSSGKVASALAECGFMIEKVYADKGERPSIHLFPTENFNIMLIDLSCSRFSLSVVSTANQALFEEGYIYNTEISYEDNLNVFLSRCGYSLHKASKSYAAICVIYSDLPQSHRSLLLQGQVHLPSIHDKEKTFKIIHSVFRRYPDNFIGISEAVRAAAYYGLFPGTEYKYGISYIFAGSYLCALNASSTSIHHCDAGALIIGNTTVSNIMNKKLLPEELVTLLTACSNLMQCTFPSSPIVIDSDEYNLDKSLSANISRRFALSGQRAPNLIFSKAYPSVRGIGALKSTFALIVKRCIKASDD